MCKPLTCFVVLDPAAVGGAAEAQQAGRPARRPWRHQRPGCLTAALQGRPNTPADAADCGRGLGLACLKLLLSCMVSWCPGLGGAAFAE